MTPPGLPILITAYKRPDKLAKCLESIDMSLVSGLYFAVDGYKSEADKQSVLMTRRYIDELGLLVPVYKRYGDKNFGCQAWVSSSISWFFEHEEFGAIIEEDIVVDNTFLQWCIQIRAAHTIPKNVMHINAFTPALPGITPTHPFLTKYCTSWGWATWRDCWKNYSGDLAGLPTSLKARYLYMREIVPSSRLVALYYSLALRMAEQGKLSTWAYRWNYSVWRMGGMALSSGQNLAFNAGIEAGATHTSQEVHLLKFTIDPTNSSPPLLDKIAPQTASTDTEIFASAQKTSSIPRILRMLVSVIVPTSFFRFVRRLFR